MYIYMYIYFFIYIYIYICVYIHTYVKWMSTGLMLACHKKDEYRSYVGLP